MNIRALLVGLMSASVILAGCAGEGDEGPKTIEKDPSILEAGKGAIAGLLVDDRFRPLQLIDNPKTEFQFQGFILLQETGEEVQTSENGEFFFIDLEPGIYTLRTSIDGHEAKPTTVNVVAGFFEEVDVLARRKASDEGFLITEAASLFESCILHTVALSFQVGQYCMQDTSGDTNRAQYQRNWGGIPDLTWLVTEYQFQNPPREDIGEIFDVVIRPGFDQDFTSGELRSGDWIKVHMINGSMSPDEVPHGGEHHIWNATSGGFATTFFTRGYFADEIRDLYAPVYEYTQDLPSYASASMRRGAGMTLGTQVNILVSAFIGEPEGGPPNETAYCGICPAG